MSKPMAAPPPSHVTYSFQPIMRQDTVSILCEGAPCNFWISAEAREQAMRRGNYRLDAEDMRTITSTVSAELTYTPHVWVGGRYYRCLECSTVRIFG